MGVRYGLSLRFWAVRSKPAATGMVHSYLEPNSQSLHKPIGGRSPERGVFYLQPIYRGGVGRREQQVCANQKLKQVYWVVGFGDSLRGEKGER